MDLITRVPIVLLSAAVMGLSLLASPAVADQPGRYRQGDPGGFRNVLPAGQNGLDNADDVSRFFGQGILPPHWADQQSLYENLLYASPTMKQHQVADYYKDASFGVRNRDVESEIHPRRGVTIIRDKHYGVPHIYGRTRSDTMFGAGYAGANDRLFLMDVLRNTGRASLSSFLGGSNIESDASQWQFAPYRSSDYRKQIDLIKELDGNAGERAARDLGHYVDGINAYIKDARKDPSLMPAEYSLLGKSVQNWNRSDVLATASLIGGIFGRGGGRELDSAQVLNALEKRFGERHGRKVWSTFRSRNDPEAPVTTKRSFPYQLGDPFSRTGLALPEPGSVKRAEILRTDSGAGVRHNTGEPGFGQLMAESIRDSHASNWELVAARNSTNGRPIAVMGPQVGYYAPQILLEQDLHGPGIHARGASFAGVNLVVQLGRGRDYAWSATSAGSDNTDTFAEVLCGGDKYHYRYKGRCRPMEKLVRRNTWTPNVIDSTPAGSGTLTAYRTAHGIVTAYGRSKGERVAYVLARTTYMHEAESVLGFSQLNDPGAVKDAESFQAAATNISFTFNWSYVDAEQTAYFLSGNYPVRAPGVSPDFPVLGTGEYDWRNWDTRTWTADQIPEWAHPQVVDPGVLVSWNNKPARDWAAADDQWGYGPVYRDQMIKAFIKKGLKDGDRKMNLAALVQAMEEPATQDIRALKMLPVVLDVIGTPHDPELKAALAGLKRWRSDGSHRRDLDRDGAYEHNAAIQVLDGWWAPMVAAIFEEGLGTRSYNRIQSMIGLSATVSGTPGAPGFADGWWGYVINDLKALTGDGPPDYPNVFCGDGNRKQCRRALRSSLRESLSLTPTDLYGFGRCEGDPQPSCWDKNAPRVLAAINRPGPFPFQNRPTFQQAVSVRR